MILGAAKLRMTILAVLAGLLAAGQAYAQTTTCNTDLDCPGTACGTQVCVKSSGGSQCMDPNTAHASGVDDGWCADTAGNMQDSNCKCRSLGATCNGFYCTFTIPPDGGTTGAGGTGGGGGAVDGGGHGGTSGTGGVMGSGGSKTSSSGGCSVAGDPSRLGSAGAGLLLAALIRRRARRRV
jgi:hypothetical protein